MKVENFLDLGSRRLHLRWPKLCDALWDEGDPKSEAAALGLLDMTGGVALPDVGVNIGGSIADAGVCSVVDEE
jgi:hypothetical protein